MLGPTRVPIAGTPFPNPNFSDPFDRETCFVTFRYIAIYKDIKSNLAPCQAVTAVGWARNNQLLGRGAWGPTSRRGEVLLDGKRIYLLESLAGAAYDSSHRIPRCRRRSGARRADARRLQVDRHAGWPG